MRRKLRFSTAWVILLLVTSTLVGLNFIDDEQSRNTLAGVILLIVGLLFVVSVLFRTLTDRIG